jgi:AraC family transcriptional regulator
MRDRLTDNVSLDQLARAAGVDRYRLTRLFREAVGIPPHRFHIAQRIIAARKLLEGGERDVAGIAAAVGFVDQSHLYRHFCRTLGVTPLEYARRFGAY